MYDANRLVWQLGDEQKERTPQGTVWSCRVVGESFDLSVQSLSAAQAKSQDHRASCGVFVFGLDRQGALADGLHGLNPRNTDTATHPAACRPALVERLVKHKIHGGNKVLCISESTRPAHLVAFVFLRQFKVNEDEQNDGARWSIHPWRTYARNV